MTTMPNFIGTAVSIVAALPATYDGSGYAALSWSASIGLLVEWGEQGDQSNDISVTTLAGRTLHTNGGKNGGEIPFTYVHSLADAGQVIIRAQNNTNTGISFRVTDPDGKIHYMSGVVANLRDMARTAESYKGQSGVARINTAIVIV